MKIQKKLDSKINSIKAGRWTAYMAAAAATSFAAAQTVDAEIHYSGVINQKIGPRDTRSFQLDPTGGSFQAGHINWVAGSSSFPAGGRAWIYFQGAQSAAVNGSEGCFEDDDICVSNLNRGDAIGCALLSKETPVYWLRTCILMAGVGSGTSQIRASVWSVSSSITAQAINTGGCACECWGVTGICSQWSITPTATRESQSLRAKKEVTRPHRHWNPWVVLL